MTYVVGDYALAVARGKVTGARAFSAYGRRTTSGAETNVLWPDGAYAFPPPAGVQMSFASSSPNDSAAGTGLRTLEMYYLDTNLAEHSEVITLNGSTPVLSVATNVRFIQCLHALTWGSGKAAAGNIFASNGGSNYSEIAAGGLRCSSSVRMVPAGKRLIVTSFFGGSLSTTSAAETIISLATPNFEGHDYISTGIFFPMASGTFVNNSAGLTVPFPLSFTAGQVMGMTFSTDKAATIVGSWFGVLENA